MTRVLPTDMPLERKEQIELDYWRSSPIERPGAASLDNLFNKLEDSRHFLETLAAHRARFEHAGTVLELGGGQGWASCLVKRLHPGARVLLSDLSPEAVASRNIWERVFGVKLDGAFPCRSYAVPLPDASVDLVFAFAAAHHFLAHGRTLRELRRILRPGGSCLYLYEPSCHAWMYGLALRRVNAIRPDLPEDVIVYHRLAELGRSLGFAVTLRSDLSAASRGPLKRAYYSMLRTVTPLQSLLPCTRDFVFTLPVAAPAR
jgi:SAM-dependent methyltransferase